MAVDLDLVPYKKASWPKKKPVLHYKKKDYSIRNWTEFFEIVMLMESQEIPQNVALVTKFEDEYSIETHSGVERLRYMPAGQVVSALDQALAKWIQINPDDQYFEDDKIAEAKILRIRNNLKKLSSKTPVILHWW